jgi:exopolyphosphatase / guanosine-5'-triphosphate,3'-diphosphate pyrophosphatase
VHAAIDVGSNTVRMIIGECLHGILRPAEYHRKITRLAGQISVSNELNTASMERTLAALRSFREILKSANVKDTRIVGTAALRRATNQQYFIDQVFAETGLNLDVIEGTEEARLMALGVLTAIDPIPNDAIIIDIGGGSTEFVCLSEGSVCFQTSYPLGVVRLCEEFNTDREQYDAISHVICQFMSALKSNELIGKNWNLIGTAGTITTLAAIDLQLTDYNSALINNHCIPMSELKAIEQHLRSLTDKGRESITGMEPGRGDLILPGVSIVLALMHAFHQDQIKVADSGLLEGTLLDFSQTKQKC